MATLALQTAIANTVAGAQQRARELEHRIEEVEKRLADAEAVLFEVTEQLGCDETRSEISCATASTARYCTPPS